MERLESFYERSLDLLSLTVGLDGEAAGFEGEEERLGSHGSSPGAVRRFVTVLWLTFMFLVADFEARYGMCAGWGLQDYGEYLEAISRAEQDRENEPRLRELAQCVKQGRAEDLRAMVEEEEGLFGEEVRTS